MDRAQVSTSEFEFVEMPAVTFKGEARPAFLVRVELEGDAPCFARYRA